MTPALFRHCAVVRLLAVSYLEEDGTRMIDVDGWRNWSTDLEQLDAAIGRELSDALTSTQPVVDIEERIAILDTVLRSRARDTFLVDMGAAVRDHGKDGWTT